MKKIIVFDTNLKKISIIELKTTIVNSESKISFEKEYANIKIYSREKKKLENDYFNHPIMLGLKKRPYFKKIKI